MKPEEELDEAQFWLNVHFDACITCRTEYAFERASTCERYVKLRKIRDEKRQNFQKIEPTC